MEQKKTVLIVEDEKNIVDIIRFNLQRTGYNTLEAYDGEAGLAMAREKKPDLILLDVMMPKMMGFDVCRALRAEGDNVPVIILTAREEEEDKILGLEIGADDYITKPFSMRELLARVKANIRRTTMLSAPAAEDNAMSAGGGITINTPNAGMTWAPEAYWDDDLNAYVVFFSSRMFTDDTRTTPVKNDKTGNSSYAQVRYAITRDFVNFTEPQMWQDTGYSRIDSTVRKIGGYYYRFTKNEQGGAAGDYITTGKSIFLERSKVLTAPTTEASPGQDPNTGWQLLEQALLPFEGPETIKLNKDDELNTKDDDGYILLSDNFAYRAFMTTGAELSKTTWDNPMTKRYPDFNNEKKPVKAEPGAQGYITQGANGGLPDKVRHGAFVNVPESVLKVTKSWTAANPTHIEAVDSTTKAVYKAGTRELTATVTSADKGTLAGSVKFSAGDWSKTVKLDAEGKATVTLPASVSGTVAVAYDGYTDGLVNPSDTTVDGIEQGKVDLAELNKQIAAAEALKESDYTADSWAKLAAALKTAKAALAAENQGEVDTAAADLKTAIEALQKAPTNPGEGDGDKGDGNKPTTPTTGDKTNVNKPGSALSNTGTAVLGLGGAVVALAIAGISLTLWRKRRA